jgi:hypothetical protein
MWRGIFDQPTRGELFTLQLHPERIDFFREALRGAARTRSREPAVWIATLDDRAMVDAKSRNRAQPVRDTASASRCRPARQRGHRREGASERVLEPRIFELESPARRAVSAAGSSREAITALSDLGYIVETGERNDGYAVHLGRVDNAGCAAIDACRRVIDESKRPLVRFGVKGMKSASR